MAHLAGCDTAAPPEPVGSVDVLGLPETVLVADVLTFELVARGLDGLPVGGAELELTADGGSVDPARTRTDPNGRAQVRWALAGSAGLQSLGIAANGSPFRVEIQALAGPVDHLIAASGDQQKAPAATELAEPLVVRAEDAYGNPVADVAVHFEAVGAPSDPQPAQVTTSTDGTAATRVTVGSAAGQAVVRASAAALSAVEFTATITAGPPASVVVTQGAAQTAPVTTTLPTPVSFELKDSFGNPVADHAVRFLPSGGGSASPASARTAADGRVSTQWTLGPGAGTQSLTLGLEGIAAPAPVGAIATPGPATQLVRIAGDAQEGATGTPLAQPLVVEVQDAWGNAVSAASVAFTTLSGGGTLHPASVVSDGSGRASSVFTLGTGIGDHRASATLGTLASVEFSAVARSGPPAVLSKTLGEGQSGTVAEPLGDSPTVHVTDAFANPVSGATVTFAVLAGGGALDQSTAVTDSSGTASAGAWTLGTTAGLQRIQATVPGVAPVIFDATALPGPAAQLVVHAGDGQSATVGTPVATDPAVRVSDAFGNGLSGTQVTFAVTAGGGSVSGGLASTDASGVARVGSWTLGAAPGGNQLDASAVGLGAVTFSATAVAAPPPPSGGFTLTLQILGSPAAGVVSAINGAASRWQSAITGDLPDINLNIPAGACGVGHAAVSGTVDDVIMFVEIVTIDGAGGTLGSAGPCVTRSGGLPVLGAIRLDVADVTTLLGNGHLTEVLVHEMGHVLGLGTFWVSRGHVSGAGGADPLYTSPSGVAQYQALGGTYPGGVPVENTGGSGTRDAHWREANLGTEIMTGWINYGSANPLSRITIGALADLGYVVDLGAADAFAASAPATASGASPGGVLRLVETPPPPPLVLPH